ncbi:hemolysin family protein [Jeotgalibacillus proteolyticus]|uniref:Transporter associated domain protein n=1 Tax=Jeotgalibacillus proteolyticus TaxID=2082395 RepID=A0A2S5G6Q5_9BACL|nr:hemolysin family protein [Jeotgalibacillus proteolyticus]PPA68668.1 transporter associated domain protein [Jeotgalibacillus proteolyticus]PPA68745.1 transporter associated domain protein [Jeotgalibacillus proteolyticus]
MDSILLLNLALVAILIALTAFFVGSEFAVVKVRLSRIDQLIDEGNKKAIVAKKLITDLDYYLSACQLGITVTALGLGWLGEPTVEKILHPFFENFDIPSSAAAIISFALAFSIVTFLHVVIGELAPKSLAIQFAEKMTLLLAGPLYWFGKIMYPFIWTLNGSARILLRTLGVRPVGHEQAHSEEELKIIMVQSFESGEINQTELSYMENIFAFDERVAKDIMVPRTQMVTLMKTMTQTEVLEIINSHPYTRYPVTEAGDKDHIIGFANVKEMLINYAVGRNRTLEDSMHELVLIHETTTLQNALLKMQTERVHVALVIDEYGGTAGLLTMEDILEEIVGEIRDEFDTDETPDIETVSKRRYLLKGRVLLEDLTEQFGLTFANSENVDTIGGWFQLQNTEAMPNDSIETDGHLFTLLEMDNHQIIQIQLDLPAKENH